MDIISPALHFVVPCAGSGSRARSAAARAQGVAPHSKDIPKQYICIAAKPLIVHTLTSLLAVKSVASICLVVSPGDVFIEDILATYLSNERARIDVIFAGGETRAKSVLAGLEHLSLQGVDADAWVLVHDAARCLVRPEWVDSLIANCASDAVGGLLAMPLADTLKQSLNSRVEGTVSREHKWLAQTPQMFKLGMLHTAIDHAQALAEHSGESKVTDESSAMEAIGHKPLLVTGHFLNFKITYPEDFALAETLLHLGSNGI